MIKATFPEGVTAITANGLHQWDRGQILEIHGASLPAVAEVHFAYQGMTVDAIVRVCDMLGGVGRVAIPDQYLTQSLPITAWIYEVGSTTGETVATVMMPIIARAKPKDAPEIPEETSDKYTELMGVVNEYFEEVDNAQETAVAAASAKLQAEIDADFDEMESALRTDMNTMHSSHVAAVEAKQEAYETEVDTFIAEHALWVPQTVTAGTFDIRAAEDGKESKTYRVWNANSTSGWGFTAKAKILYTEGTASKAHTFDLTLPTFYGYDRSVTLRMGCTHATRDGGVYFVYELNGEQRNVTTGLHYTTNVTSAYIDVSGITNCELYNEYGTAVSIDEVEKRLRKVIGVTSPMDYIELNTKANTLTLPTGFRIAIENSTISSASNLTAPVRLALLTAAESNINLLLYDSLTNTYFIAKYWALDSIDFATTYCVCTINTACLSHDNIPHIDIGIPYKVDGVIYGDNKAMAQEMRSEMADITSKEINSADLWEQGGISKEYGSPATSSVRIRTINYLSSVISKIYTDSQYSFCLYAYDAADTFIGVWDGSAFITTVQTWFKSFDLADVASFGYKYKLVLRNVGDAKITTDAHIKIHFVNDIFLEIESVRSEFTEKADDLAFVTDNVKQLSEVRRIETSNVGSVLYSYNFIAGNKYKITNNTASYINARTLDGGGADVDVLPLTSAGKSTIFTASKNAVSISLYFGQAGSATFEDLSLRVPVVEEKVSNIENAQGQFYRQSESSDFKWVIGGISLINGKIDDSKTNRIRTGFIPVTGFGCAVTLDGDGQYIVLEYASNDEEGNLISRTGAASDWVSGSYTIQKADCRYIKISAKKADGSDFDEESLNDLGGRFRLTQSHFAHRAVGRYVSPVKETFHYDGVIDDFSKENKLATLYAKWDELTESYPNIITKKVIGEVGGKEIRQYTLTPTPLTTSYSIASNSCEPLKILWVANIHGSEGAIGLDDFALFKNLVVNHKPSILWSNCVFEIIPVANPIGYEAHDRLNENGININRNFPDGWVYVDAEEDSYNASGDEPCSEYETRLLMDFVKSHPDAFLVMNRHGTDPWAIGGVAGYAASKYQSDIETIIASHSATDTMLRDMYDLIDERNPNRRAYTVMHSNKFPGSFDRWYNSVGYHGYLLEYNDNLSEDPATRNETVRRMNITAIANLLCDSVLNNRGILENNNILTSKYQ